MKDLHSTGNDNSEIPNTMITPRARVPVTDTADINQQHHGAVLRHESADNLKLVEGSQLGDYRLGCEIGRGGMGVVYEAIEITLGRKVALKILPASAKFDKRQTLRFANESRAAAQLNHPNIVPVYAVGEKDGVNYFAMRLVEGYDLSQLIKHVRYELSTDKKHSENATPHHSCAGYWLQFLQMLFQKPVLVSLFLQGQIFPMNFFSQNCLLPKILCRLNRNTLW